MTRRRSTGVHQVLVGASPGDAITNAAIELRDVLRRIGPSEIFAHHVDAAVARTVRPLREYVEVASPGDLIVYHASIGEPAVHAFLRRRDEPLVLWYHNVTPPRFFRSWDPAFAELLELGRRELAIVRDRVAIALADSEFNAAELRAVGYDDVRVVPPVVDPTRRLGVEPSPSMLRHLDEAVAAPIVLFVGQLLPHKRPDLLIEAFHVARTYLRSDAQLFLVGPHRLPPYVDALSLLGRRLALPGMHVPGRVTDADLSAIYRRASVFVTVSEHEGFCVPLLEAMAFGVPVVARARAALPETLGDAGLLLAPDAGSALVAEAAVAVLEDDGLAGALRDRGRERVAAFRPETAAAAFLDALLEVA